MQTGLGVGTSLLLADLADPATGAAATTGHAHQPAGDVPASDYRPGAPFVEPVVRRSANGELNTTLRMHYAYKNVGGHRLYLRTYEGMIPGPTLRVKPGDVLRIKLVNDLPPNRDPTPIDHSLPHQFNNTNLHTHGLHVSPDGIADNVMRVMEPGGSYDIEIAIPPDHVPGTNWYHPHAHGAADIQLASGVLGALIIEGDFADVPEIASATERLLVLTEAVFDDYGTVEDFSTLFPETAARFIAVNGVREPTITMRPGEVQRWRLLHAGWQDDIFIELEAHVLHSIARDGIPLSRIGLDIPRKPDQATDHPNALLMAPGQRVDILVQAGKPGSYLLRAVPYDQGYAAPTGPIARLVVEGEPTTMKLPPRLPPLRERIIRDEEITGTRTLTFATKSPGTDEWRKYRFLIDGRSFDPDRVDHRVRLGAVEEWTIVNDDASDDHVFHIHVNDMLLTRVNGEPLADPIWLDTAIVPRKGSITFRSRFLDFTGKFALHCHMMNHEDLGMMQIVEVYDGDP